MADGLPTQNYLQFDEQTVIVTTNLSHRFSFLSLLSKHWRLKKTEPAATKTKQEEKKGC